MAFFTGKTPLRLILSAALAAAAMAMFTLAETTALDPENFVSPVQGEAFAAPVDWTFECLAEISGVAGTRGFSPLRTGLLRPLSPELNAGNIAAPRTLSLPTGSYYRGIKNPILLKLRI